MGVIKIIQSSLIALAVCVDSFAIGLSYGFKNIKIPKISLMIINGISIIFLLISMYFGTIIKKILTHHTASIISFIILVSLGCFFILEGYIKSLFEYPHKSLEIKVSQFKIIIDIVMDCTKADRNVSGDIDLKEAIYLGIGLSLDALGIGFGSAVGEINCIQVLCFAFILNFIAIIGGLSLGKKIKNDHKNLKTFWISGVILILLGILKLT